MSPITLKDKRYELEDSIVLDRAWESTAQEIIGEYDCEGKKSIEQIIQELRKRLSNYQIYLYSQKVKAPYLGKRKKFDGLSIADNVKDIIEIISPLSPDDDVDATGDDMLTKEEIANRKY